MSYHNGSVWPHDNALIAAGMARYGFRAEAARIFRGLFEASTYIDLKRLPELFCGFPRLRSHGPTFYPVACSPQAWAAGDPDLAAALLPRHHLRPGERLRRLRPAGAARLRRRHRAPPADARRRPSRRAARPRRLASRGPRPRPGAEGYARSPGAERFPLPPLAWPRQRDIGSRRRVLCLAAIRSDGNSGLVSMLQIARQMTLRQRSSPSSRWRSFLPASGSSTSSPTATGARARDPRPGAEDQPDRGAGDGANCHRREFGAADACDNPRGAATRLLRRTSGSSRPTCRSSPGSP